MEEFFDLFLFSFPSKLFSQLYRNIGGMQCRVVFSTPTFDKYEHSRKAQIVFCPAKKSLLAQRKKNCIKESEQDHGCERLCSLLLVGIRGERKNPPAIRGEGCVATLVRLHQCKSHPLSHIYFLSVK